MVTNSNAVLLILSAHSLTIEKHFSLWSFPDFISSVILVAINSLLSQRELFGHSFATVKNPVLCLHFFLLIPNSCWWLESTTKWHKVKDFMHSLPKTIEKQGPHKTLEVQCDAAVASAPWSLVVIVVVLLLQAALPKMCPWNWTPLVCSGSETGGKKKWFYIKPKL